MKINIPNKALSHKILCGAVMLTFYLVAPQAYSSINDWTYVKSQFERGLAIGIGRTKGIALLKARSYVPSGGVTYSSPIYIKHANNTYTCYIKWRWETRTPVRPAK